MIKGFELNEDEILSENNPVILKNVERFKNIKTEYLKAKDDKEINNIFLERVLIYIDKDRFEKENVIDKLINQTNEKVFFLLDNQTEQVIVSANKLLKEYKVLASVIGEKYLYECLEFAKDEKENNNGYIRLGKEGIIKGFISMIVRWGVLILAFKYILEIVFE